MKCRADTELVGSEAEGSSIRVLVVGTDDWAIEQMVPALESSGCQALRCHDPGKPSFPCYALLDDRVCPLDVGFDVVVDVRARPLAALAPSEFGVVCALHNEVPLVVAGVGYDQPLHPWTTRLVERGGDVVSAVKAAVSTGARR